MKKILSIICIIFLIGITSAVPFYSTSYFVYAEGNSEQLTDDEILDAGLSVYLNSRNGFITIADGTVEGAKALMNATIESFLLTYHYTFEVTKLDVVAGIIIKYSPFRVSLKGTAVRVFNDLYDYLEDNGKIPNASNSNGGPTVDNIYDGKIMGNKLFYIYNSNDSTSIVTGYNLIPDNKMIALGTQVDHFNGLAMYKLWQTNNPGHVLGDSFSGAVRTYFTIQYSQNITFDGHLSRLWGLAQGTVLCANVRDTYDQIGYIYSYENYETIGVAAWFIDRRSPNTMYYGFAVHDYTNHGFFFNVIGSYNISNSPAPLTDVSINFETDNLKPAPTPPEGDNEIEYTPKDKTTNNTYNTYNEYINNYVIKNTYIENNNNGGGGSNDNPYPLDPENPSDPGGTTPDWSGNGDSGIITPDGNGGFTFNLPDFSLPDLDIDWSISGLSEKFPFSIPFDLLAFFTVLNADPETPAIEATIPLGLWEWDIDWDLHNFDNLASLLRNLEFIGFCIGLALITRNIIKG